MWSSAFGSVTAIGLYTDGTSLHLRCERALRLAVRVRAVVAQIGGMAELVTFLFKLFKPVVPR